MKYKKDQGKLKPALEDKFRETYTRQSILRTVSRVKAWKTSEIEYL